MTEISEPEFHDTIDRPAWWHRAQWLASLPESARPKSKPKYRWDDPRRLGRIRLTPVDPEHARASKLPVDERFPRVSPEREREVESMLAAARDRWFRTSTKVVAKVPVPSPRKRNWRKTPTRSDLDGAAHTYLIKADGIDLVKIGIAKNPESRLKFLQTGQPMDLHLLWSVPGSFESQLHERFAEYRVRGEWFDLTPLGDPVEVVTDAVNQLRGAA